MGKLTVAGVVSIWLVLTVIGLGISAKAMTDRDEAKAEEAREEGAEEERDAIVKWLRSENKDRTADAIEKRAHYGAPY